MRKQAEAAWTTRGTWTAGSQDRIGCLVLQFRSSHGFKSGFDRFTYESIVSLGNGILPRV